MKVIFKDLMGLATEYKKLLPKIRSKGKTGGSDAHIPDFHIIVFNYSMKALYIYIYIYIYNICHVS